MRVKNKYIIQNIKYLLLDYRFKLIIMFMLCFNFVGAIYFAYNFYYLEGFLQIFTDPYYVFAFLALILFNTLNVYSMFEKNTYYIIRFNDRKEYLIQLIKNVLTSNTIIFIINILVAFIFLNFFGGKLVIQNYMNYNIPNILYMIFYIARFLILSSIISIINTCLLKLIDSKIIILMNSCCWITFIFYPYSPSLINSIFNMPLMLCDYFRTELYSNFFMESACSILYIIVLIVITAIIFNISKNKMKKIGE